MFGKRKKPPASVIDYDLLSSKLALKLRPPDAPSEAEVVETYAPDEYDKLIDLVKTSKSKQEMELHMAKLELIQKIRKKQNMSNVGRTKGKYNLPHPKPKIPDDVNDDGEKMPEMDLNALYDFYDDLPGPIKMIVNRELKKRNVDIEEIRKHPESILALIQSSNKGDQMMNVDTTGTQEDWL